MKGVQECDIIRGGELDIYLDAGHVMNGLVENDKEFTTVDY